MSKTRANLHLGGSHWFVADQKDYFLAALGSRLRCFCRFLTKEADLKFFNLAICQTTTNERS